jgi:dephospho-CoA kinase
LVIKIGITGSIGMGKSTVSSIFRNNNIKVWDADFEVHNLYKKGKEGYNSIISIYPELKDKVEINRKKVSNLLSEKKIDLKLIEEIIHPLLIRSREEFIKKNKKDKLLIFDIPLLYETKAYIWLDYVINVFCSKKNQIERLKKRENFDIKKINYLISKQISVNQKNKKADYVINTDQDLKQVERQVINFIKTMRKFND